MYYFYKMLAVAITIGNQLAFNVSLTRWVHFLCLLASILNYSAEFRVPQQDEEPTEPTDTRQTHQEPPGPAGRPWARRGCPAGEPDPRAGRSSGHVAH